MAKGHKPRAGSRGYWPRKRIRRIIPVIRSAKSQKPLPAAFALYKAGMTSALFSDTRQGVPQDDGIVQPVTIMESPPITVIGLSFYRNTSKGPANTKKIYAPKLPSHLVRKADFAPTKDADSSFSAIQKDISSYSQIRLIVCTNPAQIGLKKTPEVFEIPLGADVPAQLEYGKGILGKDINFKDVFEENEHVDIVAATSGKGYSGPVKRFGVKIRSRKSKLKRRHVGNIGAYHPARVLPGAVPMPGQLGFQRRTEINKLVVKIGEGGVPIEGGIPNYGTVKGNYVLIKGSVPGPQKRLVIIRKAIRPRKPRAKVAVKQLFTHSQN